VKERERAAVVELLRCAADCADESCIPLTKAAQNLGLHPYESPEWSHAVSARISFNAATYYRHDTHTALLEAAALVEDGLLP
jgi:hypothetical protein